MKEIFKNVENFESEFQISNFGRLYSKRTNKILKCRKTKSGYSEIHTYVSNKSVSFRIHRLVAVAFISNPENKREVNHIDGDKSNNRSDNLEWVTSSENVIHAFKNNLMNVSKGEDHFRAVLNWDKVREIRHIYKTNSISTNAIARLYGVSGGTIRAILYNKTWKE